MENILTVFPAYLWLHSMTAITIGMSSFTVIWTIAVTGPGQVTINIYIFCLVAWLVGLEPCKMQGGQLQIAYPWGMDWLVWWQELFGHLQGPFEVLAGVGWFLLGSLSSLHVRVSWCLLSSDILIERPSWGGTANSSVTEKALYKTVARHMNIAAHAGRCKDWQKYGTVACDIW